MYKYNKTSISILKGDITKLSVDAIVNAANNSLLGGGGVDGAIHKAAGVELLNECKTIGGCPTGEARITNAGNLSCKKVIHTVGPVYKDGNSNEPKLLYNAYFNSLKLAKENEIKTIAFPSISTGVYGYPIEKAADLAIKAVLDFLDISNNITEVIFVLFSDKDYDVYKNKLQQII